MQIVLDHLARPLPCPLPRTLCAHGVLSGPVVARKGGVISGLTSLLLRPRLPVLLLVLLLVMMMLLLLLLMV